MRATLKLFRDVITLLLVVMLIMMVVLTFTDVIGRRLFNMPVYGANDITEHMMAIIIFAGLPLLTMQRGHLSVDLFDHWLLRPKWRFWHKLVDLLIAAILGLIAFEYYIAIGEAQMINEVSQALNVPRAWMYIFICITTGVAAIAALMVPVPEPGHMHEETTG